ncbi:aldolase [Setomelanomma holmii]|uniref:hydroxymethylglutaryl-CoA lyase n=1 Tax=Setomelanomma holmii TaxID=210430 RepID=A0A9P4LRG1_9PLEO|nr:aldolase [Setomelanomma holmii]
MSPKSQVRIFEVGPRDGLQNIAKSIPTATKIELIQRLRASGLRDIEVTSAVSPKAIPQLADNQQLLSNSSIQNLIKESGVSCPVLVPNTKGLDITLKHEVREVAVFVSASEGFSRANTKCSVEEGLRRAGEVATQAREHGIKVRGYISCIFEDPFDGPTTESAVLQVVQKLLGMGCYEISLGDTLGTGTAADVQRLLTYLFQNGIPEDKLAGHFHDTYGQAVSNAWTAYQLGLRAFDSSVAGLGGCPYAPGAKGNVATEDLVYMFERAGISTGVDLPKLVDTGAWISSQLQQANSSRAGAALARKLAPPLPSSSTTEQTKKLAWLDLPNQSDGLIIQKSGASIKITLNRPKNGNALTTAMISALTSFFTSAANDTGISRIVITAHGRFFCTGMDLSASSSPVASGQSASTAQFERLTMLFKVISSAPQVTIAAINGPTFGGGVGLAFACDVRIGVKEAVFTLSEVKLGLAPATISPYVVREWGVPFAREAMLSARPVSVSELKDLGAVAEVVEKEKLEDEVDAYLVGLKKVAPRASALCKDLVRAPVPGEIKRVFEEMMTGKEAEFGLREFQARRVVDWDEWVERKGRAKL